MEMPLLAAWKKISELRNLIKLWNIPSLAHSIIYEISSLLDYIETLKNESNEEGRARLDAVEKDARALIEEYSNFARTNQLSKREAELFHSCEKGIKDFSKRIWWEY
jgi:histidinol-phosphate/aromatic aminotransferase/cobyric acid decarboxylase-like protein